MAMSNVVTVTSRLHYLDDSSFGPYCENNWHFSYSGGLVTAEDCADRGRLAIIAFWGADIGISEYSELLAGCLDPNMEFRWVDQDDADHVVHDMDAHTITIQDETLNLPNEVASCLTFKCDAYGGHRKQSFYNRVYLGPLCASTLDSGGLANQQSRPSAAFQSATVTAYDALQASLDDIGVDNNRHCVYSPKHNSSGLVTSAWMDNDWDTVRRRSAAPSGRTFMTIA